MFNIPSPPFPKFHNEIQVLALSENSTFCNSVSPMRERSSSRCFKLPHLKLEPTSLLSTIFFTYSYYITSHSCTWLLELESTWHPHQQIRHSQSSRSGPGQRPLRHVIRENVWRAVILFRENTLVEQTRFSLDCLSQCGRLKRTIGTRWNPTSTRGHCSLRSPFPAGFCCGAQPWSHAEASFPLSLASLALIIFFHGPHHTWVPKPEFEGTRILTSYVGVCGRCYY